MDLPSIEVTGYGMKCYFPVAEVEGITIAVLLAETKVKHLGLLLHPHAAFPFTHTCTV